MPQIISKGKVLRPGLGVTLANRSLTRDLGLEGVLVLKVVSGSSAEQAGLRGTSQVGDGLVLGDVGDATLGERLTLTSGFIAVTVVITLSMSMS